MDNREDEEDPDKEDVGHFPRTDRMPSSTSALEQFHADMRRVLLQSSTPGSSSRSSHRDPPSPTERRHRPAVLTSDVDGSERVWTMLQHLIQIGAATEETFQIVMQAFLRRGRQRWYAPATLDRRPREYTSASRRGPPSDRDPILVCAADQLSQLLDQLLQVMQQQQQRGGEDPADTARFVSLETYRLVLQAYAMCATPRGERDYASRAEALHQRIEAMYGAMPVNCTMPVVHAYAWQQANLQEGRCAARAELYLDRIRTETDDPAVLMPCYDWVLEAWSKSGSAGSAEKAHALFRKMIALNQTLSDPGSSPVEPLVGQILTAETYSNAVLAWSKATEAGSAEKAQAILMEMIERYQQGAFPAHSEPPLIAFNGVITAWGRRGRPDKAEEIIWLMDQLRPTCRHLVPDAVSYNSVLHGYLLSRNKEHALEKALRLVNYMEDQQGQQPAIKPNAFTYNTLIKCWIQTRRPEIAERCEECLQQMERLWQQGDQSLLPTNRIYNMVINAYAKSNANHAARKAFDLLHRMKQSKHCQPDIISYTSIMECLSKSADPQAPIQAEALLTEAYQLYNETGDKNLMPNLRAYSMAILTFAKNQGSVNKARQLLLQLIDLYERTKHPQLVPNAYPYNYLLNCAANTLEDKIPAFQVATRTYQEMRSSALVKPDSFTYAFWIKCCNNLLPEGDLKRKCIAYAFEECKKEGLVTNEVLTRLVQGSPPSAVREMLEGPAPIFSTNPRPGAASGTVYRSVKVDDLPPEWSRCMTASGSAHNSVL